MRVRKLLALTLAMMLVLSTFTFGFGAGLGYIDDGVLDDYTKFIGATNDELGTGKYWAKDESNGTSATVSLGNGYEVDFTYRLTNDERMEVKYNLIEVNTALTNKYEIHVNFLILKAGSGYTMHNNTDVETYYMVDGQNEISHVVIAYEFTEKPTGSIIITKNITNSDTNDTEFDVTVTGPESYTTVVAVSEGNSVTLDNLVLGSYTVTEEDKTDYMESFLSKDVVIQEGDLDKTVDFENTKKTYDIGVEKTASDNLVNIGDVITYSVVVTNNSNVELTDILVEDSMFGVLDTDLTLAAQASTSYGMTMSAVQQGILTNIVTASSVMGDVSDTDQVDVEVTTEPLGSITFIKDVTNVDMDDQSFEIHVSGPNFYGANTQVFDEDETPLVLDNLIMGAYTFYEVVPPGYTGVVTEGSLTLTPGALDKSFTFVNEQNTGSIHIIKNIEVEDEAVHEEVRFNLSSLSNGSGVLSGYTDSNGELMFNNLLAGNYFLEEILPLDFETTYTTQVAVTIGQTTEVKVLNNMVENPADQFVYNGSSIYGYKYNVMEEGLEGWTIELYEEGNITTPVATTVTDIDGFYEFNGVDEGVYVIKEVMQSEWYNITPIQQTITIGGVGFDEETLHFSDDQSLITALPDSNIEFVAEGRFGNNVLNGDYELDINIPGSIVKDQKDFIWSNNGVPVPFELDYDGSDVTFTVDGEVLTYTNVTPGQITDMMIRTRATETNSGIMVNNLYLDGQPVGDNSVAVANGNGIDILWLRGFDLTDEFTLTGQSVMYWTDEFEPSQSRLAYQIKLGHALHQDEYWADPFMNGQEGQEYYSITVNKDVIGTATDTEFEVAVYEMIEQPIPMDDTVGINLKLLEEGNGSPPSYATTGTIIEGDPFVVNGLEPGDYWVSENPEIEGFYTQPDQMVGIIDGNEEVTITNYQYPEIEIEKTVDDTSVRVNENVTYTITVTNLGGFYLPEVVVEDEQLDFITTTSLDIGESKSFEIETSYSSTGDKVNTATASALVAVIEGEGGLYSMHPDEMDDVNYLDIFELEVSDSATVNVSRTPTRNNTYRMTIDKVADGDLYEVGDIITYTITVENTGNSTLTDILVKDDMTGFSDEIDFLNPGASREFTTTYEALVVGDLTNTATAEDNRAGTEEDDETVTVEGLPEGVPEYLMTIEKTAVIDENPIYSGEMVEFTILVTNTGDETLTNILVEDDMVDFEAVIDELAPGESEEFTVNVAAPNIPGPFTNTAKATNIETGTLNAEDTVFVEEEIPLDVPDTGVAPSGLFFGLGALVSGLGVLFTKKRSL